MSISNETRTKIEDFAHYYGFHYNCRDSASLIRDFCTDMKRGLSGVDAGMPMIPSRISAAKSIKRGKTVLALDAGGTNLRAALVSFDKNLKPKITGLTKTFMPGTKGHMSAAAFFDAIAAVCEPLLKEQNDIEGIGFCFSYEIESTEDGDAIAVSFSKESDAPEVVGKKIGENLLEAIAKRGLKAPKKIRLLNDTTATLLTGMVQVPTYFDNSAGEKPLLKLEGGPVIGFILGTGFNTAYPETCIPKIGFNNDENPQIVVCESGAFKNAPRGIFDDEFDASTTNPNQHLSEKILSGAYLGPLSLVILKHAVQEGLIRFKNSSKLLAMDSLHTMDLNNFLTAPLSFKGPLGSLFETDELDAIRCVIFLESIITERAGFLAGAILAATAKHMNAGTDPLQPLRIAIEGTTYSSYHFLKSSVENNLRQMLGKNGTHYYIMGQVENASLLGAAVAGLN